MAALLIAGTGGPGRVAAHLADASRRWSRIAFVTVPTAQDVAANGGGETGGHTAGTRTGERGISTVDLSEDDERCGAWPVLGSTRRARDLRKEFDDLFVAVQDNSVRAKTLRRMSSLGFFLPCLVHASAFVCKSATLDYGCLVSPQCTVEADAQLGMGTIIGAGATVGHDCAFGLVVRVGAGAHLGAGVRVGGRTSIGIGAVIADEVVIGNQVTVTAGAVVTDDVPDGVTVAGSPAVFVPGPLRGGVSSREAWSGTGRTVAVPIEDGQLARGFDIERRQTV